MWSLYFFSWRILLRTFSGGLFNELDSKGGKWRTWWLWANCCFLQASFRRKGGFHYCRLSWVSLIPDPHLSAGSRVMGKPWLTAVLTHLNHILSFLTQILRGISDLCVNLTSFKRLIRLDLMPAVHRSSYLTALIVNYLHHVHPSGPNATKLLPFKDITCFFYLSFSI